MADIGTKYGLGGGGFPNTVGTAQSGTILPTWHGASAAISNAGFGANTLSASPFFVPTTTVIDALCIENTGTGDNTKKVRLGLYSSSGGLPSTLLTETPEITLDANRDIRVGVLSGTYTCQANTLYYIAGVTDNTITAWQVYGEGAVNFRSDGVATRLGVPAWTAGLPAHQATLTSRGLTVSHTYGALPSSFGTPTGTVEFVFGARVG